MSTTAADNFSTLPTEVGRAQIEYPFKKNGDRTTRIVKRTYKQLAGNFTPTALGSPDATFSDHYLIEETDPQPTQTGLEMFTRTYATIPTTQTVPSSIILSKPSLSGTFPQVYGSFRLFQPDTTLLQYDAYFKQEVTSDSGIPGFYPTGGTYTLTFAGYTTGAIAYNATAGTVETALNALTSVSDRGSLTVAGSYNSAGGFVITFNAYAQITIATGSLTGGTIAKTESLLNNGYSQNVRAFIAGSNTNIISPYLTSAAGLTYTAGAVSVGGASSGSAITTSIARTSAPYFSGTFTGGTFTINVGGATAAVAYNATLATLQNAYDSLAAGLYTVSIPATVTAFDGTSVVTKAFSGSVLSTDNTLIYFVVTPNDSAPTGGTYTLTAFTQTTAAISYSATAATVAGELNALANIAARGNCTVTGDLVTGFAIAFTNAALTTSGASLTPTGSASAVAIIDGGIGRIHRATFSNPTSYRNLYLAAHNIAEGETIYIRATAGPAYYSAITNFTIPDANTVRIICAPGDAFAAVVAIDECGKRTRHLYESGSLSVPCKRVTDFHLPGVSSGITTADDIIIPASQSDGIALLLALFSGTGTFNWQVGELGQWRDGPILSITKTTVRATDL